jgi:hypothetical protein
MLVFGLDDLDAILDTFVTNMPTHVSRKQRSIPANVIFLCARFASYFCSFEWLNELLLGFIERVELAAQVGIEYFISVTHPVGVHPCP